MNKNDVELDRNTWAVVADDRDSCIPDHFERLNVDGLNFIRCSDGRFADDRLFVANEHFVYLIDGVLLNKAELLEEHDKSSVEDLITHLLNEYGADSAIAQFRGPFSGAILDRGAELLHVFGNQTGDTAAFFYEAQLTRPLVSNSFDLITRLLDSQDRPLTFDEHTAKVMLTYGFMIDDHTFAKEVTRVTPGGVATFDRTRHEVKTKPYWHLQAGLKAPAPASIDDAVVELDRLFRRAVNRCFLKDLEYGYSRHLVDITGGFDARTVNIVARDLGYGAITNITYSQSTSDEREYSSEMANRLGNEWLYHPLDSGNCALDPEGVVRLNSGMAMYTGITGGLFTLRSLNFTEYGLEHTGQIGGAVIGTYAHSPVRTLAKPGAGAYSKVNIYPSSLNSEDEELFLMRTRAFRGSMSSHLTRQHFTFAVSAYADVDLIEFMFSLPLEWRVGHRIFLLWLEQYYPDALRVPSTRFVPFWMQPAHNVSLFIKKAVGVVARKARRALSRYWEAGARQLDKFTYSMNPLESWHSSNRALRHLFERYRESYSGMSVSSDLKVSLSNSFGTSSSLWDQALAITVIASYDLYFRNDQSGKE